MATEIKSQICTTREQSERLLALGVKPETADMSWIFSYHWECYVGNPEELYTPDEDGCDDVYIPAWSLHRLLCLYGLDYTIKEVYNNAEECYGMLISAIGIAIEDGDFPKEYLK